LENARATVVFAIPITKEAIVKEARTVLPQAGVERVLSHPFIEGVIGSE